MTRIVFAAALALAVTLPAISAQAQAPRTFVSAAGSDSNPCSFAAPCRHFQAAVNATSVGGEVDALDPAGYGPIIISHAITIEGQGWSYIAPPANGAAIAVSAAGASDKIVIHGVSLNGVGITGITTGIQFNSGGALIVRDCVIQQFIFGMVLNAAPSNTELSNSVIENNLSYGVLDAPTANNSAFAFDHVRFFGNATGLSLQDGNSPTALIKASGSDSIAAGNVVGFDILGNTASLFLDNVRAVNNGTAVQARTGLIFLSRSALSGNSIGYQIDSGGAVETTGNNLLGDDVNHGTLTQSFNQ